MSQDIRLSRQQREAAVVRLKDAMRASQVASDMMDEVFCEFVGINRTDGRCLDVVDRFGEITAGQLAEEVGLTTGAATAMVDRLERAGLLERTRDRADRRKVLIRLTPEAKEIGQEVYGEMARASAPYIASLSDGDLLTLISFLDASRHINVELANTVRQRILKRKVPLRQRLEQARALKDDAKALFKTVKREMKDWVKVDFLVGDTRWVKDERGRWVEEKRR